MTKPLLWLLAVLVAFSGCGTVRNVLGLPAPGDPTITLRSAEAKWVLVKNPRFGAVPSEPEFTWVEEDKVPWTFSWGVPQRASLAPPEVVAKYGPPPGGGRIAPRQGVITAPERMAPAPGRTQSADAVSAVSVPPPAPTRGFVVWVDTTRIVIDLTAQDGVKAGAVVSLRRDRIPIVHPVTGERLGELDEEVATARVTELRDRFSVAEIQTVAQGAEVRIRDRVVLK